ncbi:hypothetical protein [Planctomyces sp. SH-PL62]|uniref:hypothetical protein n=1 Tax=Planctomyces sp. SH-PL62 TaxID=1636152 RepID=UPI0018D39484|nr:hypothetical protein [Planctomyces sp. SH-PL62]
MLYLDYGDLFPSGVLDGIDAGQINSHDVAGGVNINGPQLDGPDGTFDSGASVQLTAFDTLYGTDAASFRAAISVHVRQMLAPFDVTVVELTSATTMIEGNEVRAAANLDDVSRTLAANNATSKHNDSYMFIVQALIGGTTDDDTTNPQRFPDNGYGGIANSLDIGSTNQHEGSAFTLLRDDDLSAERLGDVIVHEAGHLLGFRHVYRQDSSDPPPPGLGVDGPLWDLYSKSEVMSYLRNREDSNVISRLPMIRGDGNTDPAVLNTTPNPYDHLAADPEVGASAMEYVTGSAAHDIITITKIGPSMGQVVVQPFFNDDYTTPITIPGTTGTSYSYLIDLTKPLVIDAAAGDDRLVLDGDLNTVVTVRGGSGTDSLVVDGKGAASATYTPSNNVIIVGATTFNLEGFESDGGVRLTDLVDVSVVGSGAADSFTASNPADADVRVTGTVAGVSIVPLLLEDVAAILFDARGGDDSLSIDASTDLIFIPITYDGGAGSDSLTMSGSPATSVDELIYTPGPNPDQGRLAYEDVFDDALMRIAFANLEPLFAFIPAATLTVYGTNGDDAITYTASLMNSNWGRVAVNGFESITFANKANLNIQALGGTDAVALQNASTPTGLTSITVDGGPPADADHLTYTSRVGLATTLNLALGTIAETSAPTVTYSGVASIAMVGFGTAALAVVGTAGDERFEVTGPITGSGRVTTVDTIPTVSFNGYRGGLTADGALGFDTVRLVGGDGPTQVTSAGNVVTIDGMPVTLAGGIERLEVETRGGNDAVTLGLAIAGLFVYVDAGDGNDVVTLSGSTTAAEIRGGMGDDTLTGGDGNDRIEGGPGNDVLTGGRGSDQMFGGAGSDRFVWNNGDGSDVIEGGGGNDVVRVFGAPAAGNDFLVQANGTRVLFRRTNLGLFALDIGAVEQLDVTGSNASDSFVVGDLRDTDLRRVNVDLGADAVRDLVVVGGTSLGDVIGVTSPSAGVVDVQQSQNARVVISNSSANCPLQPGDDVLTINAGQGDDSIQASMGVEEEIGLIVYAGDGDDFVRANGRLFGEAGNDRLEGAGGDCPLFIDGGAGNDSICGNDGVDVLLGGLGNDSIWGAGGNDYIDGGAGRDRLAGNDGHDVIEGGIGSDVILGGAGDDKLSGGDGDDVILGDADSDCGSTVIYKIGAGQGNDYIDGGAGDDTLNGDAGYDVIFGGDGDDLIGVLSYQGLAFGEDDIDVILGGAGDDRISGGAGADVIDGGDGDDTIFGDEDADQIYGGPGDDVLEGGIGDDRIEGGLGADRISGGDGDDLIAGQEGDDIISGDAGNDQIDGGDGADQIDGGDGDDRIWGSAGDDVIRGGAGNDTIDAGTGADLVMGQDGDDVILGGEGDDRIWAGAGDDVVHGGLGADFIYGGAGRDRLCGGLDDGEPGDPTTDGNDYIEGGDDDDVLVGDAGDDTLLGGSGSDQIWGSVGNDSLSGGDGDDFLVGGDGDDFIDAGNGADVAWGLAGNDVIWGGFGNDLLYGGDGDDVILGGTPETANVVHAPRDPSLPNDGADVIYGGLGDDQVDGGNGDNVLDAGDDGIREIVLGGFGNDIGYSHQRTDPRTYDVMALDGGQNHDFHGGGLFEVPPPEEVCDFVTFVIPASAYTGWQERHDGVVVAHPPRRPNRSGPARVQLNGKAPLTKPSPFAGRQALIQSVGVGRRPGKA